MDNSELKEFVSEDGTIIKFYYPYTYPSHTNACRVVKKTETHTNITLEAWDTDRNIMLREKSQRNLKAPGHPSEIKRYQEQNPKRSI